MLVSGQNVSNFVDVLWWLAYGPSKDKPVPPIPVHDTSPPLFALIIGINTYESADVPTLKGAVADADSIKEYLEQDLKVQESHIRILRETQATRAAIIAEFKALQTNPDIKHGDPILIYYAGHGGEKADWEAAHTDSITQMLIPHDYQPEPNKPLVYGIPDRTIGVLISGIAKSKGDNITVIFDCCHSASGTRDDNTHLHRSVEIKGHLPAGLDQHIWDKSSEDRSTDIAPGFLYGGLRSHVLLAACGAKEKAKEEDGRGVFTKAFLEVLRTVAADTVTYADLIRRIHALPQQNPQCEGLNQGRILFNAKAPSTGRVFYEVHKEGNKCVLGAGTAHGITKGAEFAVYENRESLQNASPLGTLVVAETGVFTTTILLDDAATFPLAGTGYALQIRAGEEEDLRLHIEMNDQLVPIFDALSQDMRRMGTNRKQILLVDKAKAELDIAISNDKVVFNIMNPQVTQFGLNKMPFHIQPTYEDVYPVIQAAAHYYWHLRRNNSKRALQGCIQLQFMEVKELDEYDDDYNPVIEPIEDDLNVAGVVDLVVEPDKMYGVKLVNNSGLDLYPALFYFDNSDLSITSYYQPPSAAKTLDVPLPKKINNVPGSLTIGYGSGGTVPFVYFMRDGQDVDVGFLKLFLTTEPVDYSNIPQTSPFDVNDRAFGIYKPKPPLIWDTLLVAVVQRRVPT